MVDIAMCTRRDCGKRGTCFRYLAEPDEYYQSYIVIDKDDLSNGCDEYWRCRNKKELYLMNKWNRL